MKLIVNTREERQQILQEIRELRKTQPNLTLSRIIPEMVFVEKLDQVDSEREEVIDDIVKDLSHPKGMDADPIEFK